MSTKQDWVPVDACGCCGADRSEPAGRAQGVGLRRCASCGTLRFEAVAPPEAVYRDGYHTGEIEYGWDYTSGDEVGYEEAVAAARLAWIERHARPGRLVDVGGGLGYFAGAASARGWDATLLEPVRAAVETAAERFGVRGVLGGAADLPGIADPFDVVAFVHCIEHIPSALETLRGARDALTPSGLLYVEVPNHGSAARRFQGDRWLGWQAGEHVYVFDARSLRGLLARAGYEIVAARSFVPGWHGLVPDAYGHFLGLAPLLDRAIRTKRRLARSASVSDGAAPGTAPRPIEGSTGLRRAVFRTGFDALARLEERTGLGTNLQVLARVAR